MVVREGDRKRPNERREGEKRIDTPRTGKWFLTPYNFPRSSFCTAATVRLCVEEGTAAG
jgi:hypothetical protein